MEIYLLQFLFLVTWWLFSNSELCRWPGVALSKVRHAWVLLPSLPRSLPPVEFFSPPVRKLGACSGLAHQRTALSGPSENCLLRSRLGQRETAFPWPSVRSSETQILFKPQIRLFCISAGGHHRGVLAGTMPLSYLKKKPMPGHPRGNTWIESPSSPTVCSCWFTNCLFLFMRGRGFLLQANKEFGRTCLPLPAFHHGYKSMGS